MNFNKDIQSNRLKKEEEKEKDKPSAPPVKQESKEDFKNSLAAIIGRGRPGGVRKKPAP